MYNKLCSTFVYKQKFIQYCLVFDTNVNILIKCKALTSLKAELKAVIAVIMEKNLIPVRICHEIDRPRIVL